jgi:nucleoside-diphosphate-sugar epimerase
MLKELGAEVVGLSLPLNHLPQPLYSDANIQSLLSTEYFLDIRDYNDVIDAVQNSRVDYVFHLAAQAFVRRSVDNPLETITTNITGTAKLLRTGVPMILISTASVYSGSTVARKEDEAMLSLPSPYAWSKRQAELLAEAQGAVILRPRAVYGPGDPHLEPRLLTSLQGSVIRLPGSNRQMSLTHVNNLADAIVASLNWESGYYNIADTVVYSRDEVIASLLHSRGLSARVLHIPKHLAILLSFLSRAVPSRYAIEQLANPVILDLTRSLAAGYAPRFALTDYLNNIQDGI